MAASEPAAATADEDLRDLSLREASEAYDVSPATLVRRVRAAQVAAYKVRGPWGREWRVSRRALEDAGYRLRPEQALHRCCADPQVASLERELARMRRVVAAEQRRVDLADRELGQLMLERGRLRSELARAGAGSMRCADCPEVPADRSRT
jgi:hypothetical protein